MTQSGVLLSQEDFQSLVNLLCRLPGFEDPAARRACVAPAFLASPRGQVLLSNLPLHGTSHTAATLIIERLWSFGHLEPGVHALGALLRHVGTLVGQEDHDLVERLIRDYHLHAPPPGPPTPPVPLAEAAISMHFLDEASFRWDRLEMRELRALLARMYPGQQAVEDVLDEVPYPTFKVNWTPTVYAAWKDILKRLHGAQLLRDLIRVVLADEDQARHHQALRDLTGPRPLLPTGRLEDSTELTWKAVSETDAQGLERLKLAGRPDLMTPAFMAEGVRVKDAVARLEAEFGSGSRLCGTGFLIGENLLLTCFHVLHAGMGAEAARKVEVKFGYELGLDDIALPWQIFAGDCSSIEGDRKYDWSVIRLQPVPGMDRPRLALGSTKPLDVNDRAYVIQHPQGKEMRVALHGNQVRHVDDEVLQYLADTDQGSSGAPVFNDRWQVVGLHRRYVELKGDGDLYRNEAVNIRRVMAALRAKGIPFTALADPTADEGDAAP